MRPRRSCLVVPALNRRMVEKAARIPADQVVLDLEDACPPSGKEDGRSAVVDALRTIDFHGKVRAVRVNGATTHWCYRDIIEVVDSAGAFLDAVVVPKVEQAADVWFVEYLLRGLEQDLELEREIRLDLLIETAAGACNLATIAHAGTRVDALVFGAGDYAASLGIAQHDIGAIDRSYHGHQWHWVMSALAAHARAVGAQPIDGAYGAYEDVGGFRHAAHQAKVLGFAGKWCIHPDQVAPANEVFSPSPEEIEAAQRLMQTYAEAVRHGQGAIALGGTLVDEASRKLASATLARAHAATSTHRPR